MDVVGSGLTGERLGVDVVGLRLGGVEVVTLYTCTVKLRRQERSARDGALD